MRPAPIPDQVSPGTRRVVMAAPNGDLTDDNIRPVEALVTEEADARWYTVMLVLESGDLELLEAGHPIWLSFAGGVPVFAVSAGIANP